MFTKIATNTAAPIPVPNNKPYEPADLAPVVVAMLSKALPAKLPAGAKVKWKALEPRPTRQGVIFNLAIDQNQFGIFAAIIDEASIKVEASQLNDAKHGQLIHARVSLAYTHPGGGSNGSTIGTFYFQPGGTVLEYQKNR